MHGRPEKTAIAMLALQHPAGPLRFLPLPGLINSTACRDTGTHCRCYGLSAAPAPLALPTLPPEAIPESFPSSSYYNMQ